MDRTTFTFNPLSGGIYTVTFAALDAPAGTEAPSPITLTPFSIAAGGLVATIDVFNNPADLNDIVLGVTAASTPTIRSMGRSPLRRGRPARPFRCRPG